MKSLKSIFHMLLALAFVFTVISCGGDEDTQQDDEILPDGETSIQAPETVIADIPEIVFQQAPEVILIQSFSNAMASWVTAVEDMAGNPITGGQEWTTVDPTTGDSITVKAVTSGGTTQWTVTINGQLAWSGEVSGDGAQAQWEWYDTSGEVVIATYTASTDASGNHNFEINMTEGTLYTGTVHADGSGNLTMRVNGATFLEIEWNADGSGTRKLYDNNGNVIMETSW